MNSLQSQASPLRTRAQFYKPYYPKKQAYTRRNFAEHYMGTKNPILLGNNINMDEGKSKEKKNTISYVGELQKVQYLNRDFKHQDLYYPDPEKNMKRIPNMYSTSQSRKSSMTSLHPISNSYLKTIEKQRQFFAQTHRTRSQRKSEMNLTFYNTKEKSNTFMEKFNDDQYLDQRCTPAFQNMLHRSVVTDKIIEEARKTNSRKFVKGY